MLLVTCWAGWSYSQEVAVVTFEQLQQHIDSPSGKIKIYNYWATYCRPCIKEMPYFEEISQEYRDRVEVYFVSLDFIEDLDTKVKPFLSKKGIVNSVILLDDIDYNSWINRINPEWSGAIPATDYVLPGNRERLFHEGSYEKEELKDQIEHLINKI